MINNKDEMIPRALRESSGTQPKYSIIYEIGKGLHRGSVS